jgi:hypothetical protein
MRVERKERLQDGKWGEKNSYISRKIFQTRMALLTEFI